VHTPAWQVWLCVQLLPSVHPVPFGEAGLEHVPVETSHTPATWHWSLAVHKTGFVPVQMPAWQLSVCVQVSPSLQPVPFGDAGLEHVPVDTSHSPATWHWSLAAHTTGFAPVQTPAWQLSLWVHALLSLQPVPFTAVGSEHVPVPVSHTPATWHWSLAVHTTGFVPVHTPAWHLSVCVQASLSLHAVSSATFPSDGHAPAPSHASGTSQSFAAPRHCVVTGSNVHVAEQQLPGCPLDAP